ncbi:hypothetical protein Cantr_00771 [Candida viswanathii]|uniref:Uncharacterized protein n=1 Tax=Candida viswanathii TaxID=5486 RepID=A0A367YFX2_9ASCO|nr:hypothetical protein Cantr_00771 [Candida viswanathii]
MDTQKHRNRSKVFLNYLELFNQRIRFLQAAEEYFRTSSMIQAMNVPIGQHGDFFDFKIEEFSERVDQIDKDFLRALQLDPHLGLPQSKMNLSVYRQEIRKELTMQKMDLFDQIYGVINRMIAKHQKLHKDYRMEIEHIEMDFISGKIDELEYISRVLGDTGLDDESRITEERGVSSITFASED